MQKITFFSSFFLAHFFSGDMYLGMNTKPNLFGLRFAGHKILEEVLGTAIEWGMKDAKIILLGGESAGGKIFYRF